MLNQMEDKGINDIVTRALEDIDRIVSDWLVPIKKDCSHGGR